MPTRQLIWEGGLKRSSIVVHFRFDGCETVVILKERQMNVDRGDNPGYPASHGCIRLPMKFAARLFELTQTGSPDIIEA